MAPPDRHPDTERLAEYADDVLGPDERSEVEQHLAACADCRAAVAETMAFVQANPVSQAPIVLSRGGPSKSRRWVTVSAAGLAIAAALAIAVRLTLPDWELALFGPRGERPELQELIAALAKEPARPIEGRLSGGFKFAAPPSPLRGLEGREPSPDVRIAVGRIEKRALEKDSVENLAALGVALLSIGNVDRAIGVLEDAAARQPNDRAVLNDLGAAYLARGRALNRPEDYPRALASIERALDGNRPFAEARFNRALALEMLHLNDAAAQAWREYLTGAEPSAQWQDEARQHLKALTDRGAARDRERAHNGLLAAIRGNDAAGIGAVARTYPSVVRRRLQDSVNRWADECLSRTGGCSSPVLVEVNRVAAVLAQHVGDTFEADWAASLGTAAASNRARDLARAVQLFRKGAELNDAFKFEEAAPYFQGTRAALGLRDALGIAAQLELAAIKYHLRAYSAARADLDDVIRAATLHGYSKLLARAELVVGLIHVNEGSYSAGLESFSRSAAAAERARDLDGFVNARTSAGETLSIIGRNAEAWTYYLPALAASGELESARVMRALLDAGGLAAADEGLPETARRFYEACVVVSERGGVAAAASEAQLRLAQALHRLGAADDAVAAIHRARFWNRQASPTNADFNEARIAAVEGEIVRASNPQAAVSLLTDAIAYYRRAQQQHELPVALLTRGRAWLGAGRADLAANDFAQGLSEVAVLRASLHREDYRVSYADALWDLVDEVVRLNVDRANRPDVAFQYVERARGRALLEDSGTHPDAAPLELAAVGATLEPGTAVVYYHALPDRLLTWVITSRFHRFHSVKIPSGSLAREIGRLRAAINRGVDFRDSATDLFDTLIRPLDSDLAGVDTLNIAPDALVAEVPFAVLFNRNTGRFLVETYAHTIVPSLTLLTRNDHLIRTEHPTALLVGVADAHDLDGRQLPSLPFLDQELGRIATVYESRTMIVGTAATKRAFLNELGLHDVVHFAGHAIVNRQVPGLSLLMFSAEEHATGALYAADVVPISGRSPSVVVLASCESAGGGTSRSEGVLSLARPFIAAGVGSVVAALWPVEDRSGVDLFVALHRRLAAGHRPEDALRFAQLTSLSGSGRDLRRAREWAGIEVIAGRRAKS